MLGEINRYKKTDILRFGTLFTTNAGDHVCDRNLHPITNLSAQVSFPYSSVVVEYCPVKDPPLFLKFMIVDL
jgi:hypothetical protein